MCLYQMVKFVFLNFFHSFQECLEVHALMVNALIRTPGEIENKDDKEVLVNIFDEMMEFRSAMAMK
jgi:hypothetical protein